MSKWASEQLVSALASNKDLIQTCLVSSRELGLGRVSNCIVWRLASRPCICFNLLFLSFPPEQPPLFGKFAFLANLCIRQIWSAFKLLEWLVLVGNGSAGQFWAVSWKQQANNCSKTINGLSALAAENGRKTVAPTPRINLFFVCLDCWQGYFLGGEGGGALLCLCWYYEASKMN